jgi:hypothetical protein
MKTFLQIILIAGCQLLIANYCFTQVSNTNKINPRAVKMYEDGIAKATDNRFDDAISYLLQAIYLDSNYVDAYLSLAGVYGQTRKAEILQQQKFISFHMLLILRAWEISIKL